MSEKFDAFDEDLFHLLTKHFGKSWSHVWDAEEGGFYLRLTVHSQSGMWKGDEDD
jgi:hypothetical protein